MKLYFAPGACSLAPHLVARELGLTPTLVRVNLRSRQLGDGSDFLAVNPKGQVPVLELDSGERLTEVAVILQALADLAPGGGLLPPVGTLARLRVLEWLNFIATELHKGFSPLFAPGADPAVRAHFTALLGRRLGALDAELARRAAAGRPHLSDEGYTVADAYLYNVLRWIEPAGLDATPWPALRALRDRVGARPATRAACEAEGLPA